MQFFRSEKWGTLANGDSTASITGNFVGVAIGPDSHAGRLRVNDALLQDGYPLPLAGKSYKLTRDILPANQIAEIVVLELALFECMEEMATWRGRAPGRFKATANLTSAALTSVLKVPCEGRRDAKVEIYSAGDLAQLGVTVYGRQYNAARGAVDSIPIVTYAAGKFSGTAAACAFYLVAAGANLEAYEGIDIELSEADAVATAVSVDVTTIGDQR